MTDSRTLGQSVPKEGLFLMDGIEGLRSLPKHSVDMLLTDPPYGTTRNYWDVPLPLPELWEAVKWAVKPNGAVLFFAYKSVAFVWLKKNKKANSWFYGLGFWTRGNAEICLLATKGHPKRQAANIHQFIISPIEAHSKKPDEARAKIISLMGDLPRVELFARQTPPGWAVWGNEVTPTIPDFGTHCPEVQKGV